MDKIPIFDGSQTISEYMRSVEDYTFYNKSNNSDIVLKMINDMLRPKNKYKSLTHIKDLKESIFNKKLTRCFTVLKDNKDFIENKLKLNLTYKAEELDYLIYCLKRIIKAVNFKLSKKLISEENYYTILTRIF